MRGTALALYSSIKPVAQPLPEVSVLMLQCLDSSLPKLRIGHVLNTVSSVTCCFTWADCGWWPCSGQSCLPLSPRPPGGGVEGTSQHHGPTGASESPGRMMPDDDGHYCSPTHLLLPQQQQQQLFSAIQAKRVAGLLCLGSTGHLMRCW